jgi:hypothetical protein
MKTPKIVLIACGALLVLGGAAGAVASDYWFHVRVEEGHGGARVSVNLPISLFERALPLIPELSEDSHHIHFDHTHLDVEDLRAMWRELRDSPDMTLVKVEDHGENVRVWKEKGHFYVNVDERHGDKVDVRLPLGVVDALLSGDRLDVRGAVEALVAAGGGDFVTINDDRDGDRVRVWIDRTPEAD